MDKTNTEARLTIAEYSAELSLRRTDWGKVVSLGTRPLLALAHRIAARLCEAELADGTLPEITQGQWGAYLKIEVTERGGRRAAQLAGEAIASALADELSAMKAPKAGRPLLQLAAA